MEPQLLHSVGDGVATVVIHHPAKRNAMTADMWRALPPLLDGLAADPDVRVLVLTGEGGTFCAGADISTLRGSSDEAPGARARRGGARRVPQTDARGDPRVLRRRRVQLAAACDLRFAEEGARFGVTPAKLGIVYAASATRRLVSLVVPATAKYLLFSGELIDTERALRTGLVDEVLPEGELDKQVGEFTRVLAARSLLTQASAKEEFAGADTSRTRAGPRQARGSDETARASPRSWSARAATHLDHAGVRPPRPLRRPPRPLRRPPRLLQDEAALRPELRHQMCGSLLGRPGVVGRLRVVLRQQLYGLCVFVARDPSEQGEPHVDAGRHAGRGDVLPVEHHPLSVGSAPNRLRWSRASQCEVARRPSSSPAAASSREPVRTGGRPGARGVGGAQAGVPAGPGCPSAGSGPVRRGPRCPGRGTSARVLSAVRARLPLSLRTAPVCSATKTVSASGRRPRVS